MNLSRPGRPQGRKGAKKRGRSLWKWMALLTCFALIAVIISLGYLYYSSEVVRETVVQVVHQRGLSPKEAFPRKDRINILLLGTDLNHDRQGRPLKESVRSDTIMVAGVDFSERKASLLSIPRDTRVAIPGHGIHKINAAHAYGGAELAIETVEKFLGIGIDYYVKVNYKGFERMIDLLGGVEVDVPKVMKYDDNWGKLHIDLKPGFQKLSGEQSIGYVRFRNDPEGDVGRMRRQQEFALAVRSRLLRPGNLPKVPAILDTFGRSFEGNLSYSQMLALAYFVKDIPRERITMATVPGRFARVFWWPDKEQLRAKTEAMFGSYHAVEREPAPGG